jgi:class 3 adenylate cyclase/prephenate dehydratase
MIGAITAYRQEVRPFTDKQIALLRNFAAQAVIAMENARLITETREALEQQTATAEVLQVINSSPGDLAPVFEAMLEKAMQLCEAKFGILNTYDGENFHRAAARGVPPAFEERRLRLGPMRSGPGTRHGRIPSGETDVLHTLDLMAEDSYRDGDPDRRAFVELAGARTALVVALRKEGTLLGTITIFRQEVRAFTDKQIALLQNFAAQAVIAMENARLITETREALDQQTATAEVLGVINSSPGELGPVFDAMLEKTLRLCEAAHGNFLTYDGEVFHQAAFRGEPQFAEYRRQQGPLRPAEIGQLARVVQGGGTLHRIDAREGEAYRDDPAFRQMVDGLGIRTSLTVPLRKGDALLGAVRAYRREVRPFTDKQIALVENFAAQAVIAIENTRLITETREALEQQTATAEVLQVINSSPGDVAPVFDAILENAHRLCGIALGELELYEDGKVHAVAMRGVSGSFAELLRQPFVPPPGSPPARLLAGERMVQITDVSELARERPDDPRAQTGAQHGLRTALFVPLRKDETLLGYITGYRREERLFSEKEIALLENFAAQAVIAMENARLLGELRQRTDEVGELNRDLEARVAEQVDELGRVGRLKHFLAPQLAELIVSQGDEKILESHRREIVVVFCDLRGYTAFTETAEPEEVLDFLREYHGALGPLVSQFEGTLDQFSGDGIMVFFNDPVPCPDPAERAVKMAIAMREEAGKLIATWRRDGCELGFGAGIAQGYATLGQIGFSERSGYTAIGTVCNLAARLCAEAKDGQILISSRVARAVEAIARLEDLGNLELKGLRRPVAAFNVVQNTSLAEARPHLTIVAREPGA